MRISCLVIAALGTLMAPTAGKAATITTDATFTATPFVSVMGTTPPVDPVTGSFHLTFDPTLFYFDATTISINSLNINVDGGVVFSYNPLVSILTIGGSNVGSGAFFWSTNDFSLGLKYDGAGFTLDGFSYSQAGVADAFTYGFPPSTVPLPGALPLVAAALAGLAGAGWWKRRTL
jgi:hypothetical protein